MAFNIQSSGKSITVPLPVGCSRGTVLYLREFKGQPVLKTNVKDCGCGCNGDKRIQAQNALKINPSCGIKRKGGQKTRQQCS